MQNIDLTKQPLAELLSAVGKHKETPEHLKEAIFDDLNNHADLDSFSPEYLQELLVQGDRHGRVQKSMSIAPVVGALDGLEITTADIYKFSMVFCWVLREKKLSEPIRDQMRGLLSLMSEYMDLEQTELVHAAFRLMLKSFSTPDTPDKSVT